MMAKYGDREDVTEADLRQCIDDVASLKESGKLWSPDTYENLAFDFKNRNTVVKALCPVSYTHLDVYKRQLVYYAKVCNFFYLFACERSAPEV